MSLTRRSRRDDNKMPYELWYGKQLGLERFRIFSIECFAHIHEKTCWRRERNLIKKRKKLHRDVMFKPEQVSMEIVNLNLPKIIEREDMYAQSDEVFTYESAESEHETIEQPHVAGENVRQLRDRRAIKRSDVHGCPMMYVVEKLPVDLNEEMKSEKRESYGRRLCVMR